MSNPVHNFSKKIKWLMLSRLLFAVFLMGGTIVYRANENLPYLAKPFVYLYWLISWILVLSICYAFIYEHFKNDTAYATVQIVIDTLIVTAIVFLTGCFSSIFTFLYLIVIICASMLLSRKGSLMIAAFCSLQYGLLIDLAYYQVINNNWILNEVLSHSYEWNQVIYKICTVMAACLITALLSSYLAEQERIAQSELNLMEGYLKRVENMAVVGEMAAGLAHEIKNPIASLSGSIQLLLESGNYNSVQQKLMQIVDREAGRLNTLASEFLLFARPKTGSVTAVSVSKILEETIEQCMFDSKFTDGIIITKNLEEELWTEMDSDHLRQIVLNLMLNAAESIKGEGGEITVNAYSLRSGFVRIKIIDNGVGMSEELLQSIFDPFFTTKTKGTGLGLSIVHRLLETYGCQIEVKSDEGAGTEFHVKLKQLEHNGGKKV